MPQTKPVVDSSLRPRVLIIGLDAFTPGLVEKWVADSRLPNVANFLRDGAWGAMNSVPNRNSAPAWSTMVTGLNPGKHGIFFFTEDNPDRYDYKFVNGSFRHGRAFWSVLSDEGQRVCVMNVPLSFPAEPVNGAMISGLDTPSADDPRFTHPPELRHRIKEWAGGNYPIYPGIKNFMMSGQADQALDQTHRAIDIRASVARQLMSAEEWDAFMVVFVEADQIQHFFWRQMEDPSPKDSARERSAIQDIYEHLDRVVGDLVKEAGPDTIVVLVSDHGARYDNGLAPALPSWLEQLGLLSYRAQPRKTNARSLVISSATRTFGELNRRLPSGTKHQLTRLFPWLRRRLEVMVSFGNIDWARTRAYTDGHRPEIWVNLKGRQPQGCVAPEEYESVRQEVIDGLTSALCAATGRPLVRQVLRREEAYSGPFTHLSPDLVVEWTEDQGSCLDIRHEDGREYRLKHRHLAEDPTEQLITGQHAQLGIVALRGPGIKRGHIEDAQIADVAPTILLLRDAPIPSDCDGKVLSSALEPALLAARPAKVGGKASTEQVSDTGYSEEEESQIHERLHGLGYVE
jgi:predicted AlkP superfamily phosphohydrolase/phosphomutase